MHGWLFIQKDIGITSFFVINFIKTLLKVKIGHIGTLDPFTSGFLLIGIGLATNIINILYCMKKHYIFTICWGLSTDTGDSSGNIIFFNFYYPSKYIIMNIMNFLLGYIYQKTHMYSSKNICGYKSYFYSRLNLNSILLKNRTFVYSYNLLYCYKNIVKISLVVSSGFYVRSFVIFLSNILYSYAHVVHLYRKSFFLQKNIFINIKKMKFLLHKKNIYDFIKLNILPLNFFLKNIFIYMITKQEMNKIINGISIISMNAFCYGEKVFLYFNDFLVALSYYYNLRLIPFKIFYNNLYYRYV